MLNRLLAMIYILLSRGTVTAGQLAERFEVSVRTIYRDVETLSMAGIPVYTRKGKNGGISLTEQFVLDKMLITEKEQAQILSALASLKETGAEREDEVLQKLGDFFRAEPLNWVSIDFSDWSGRRKELFEQIREAILSHKILLFDYYGQDGGMSHRAVEPMQLLFKDYTWYLRAFCRKRKEMRLFKVLRMKRVVISGERFARTMKEWGETWEMPEDEKMMRISDGVCQITLCIDKKEAYRIYDRFEEEQIEVLPDGSFQIQMDCILDDWIYGMILSFGPSAKVLAPEEVRAEVEKRISEMGRNYGIFK